MGPRECPRIWIADMRTPRRPALAPSAASEYRNRAGLPACRCKSSSQPVSRKPHVRGERDSDRTDYCADGGMQDGLHAGFARSVPRRGSRRRAIGQSRACSCRGPHDRFPPSGSPLRAIGMATKRCRNRRSAGGCGRRGSDRSERPGRPPHRSGRRPGESASDPGHPSRIFSAEPTANHFWKDRGPRKSPRPHVKCSTRPANRPRLCRPALPNVDFRRAPPSVTETACADRTRPDPAPPFRTCRLTTPAAPAPPGPARAPAPPPPRPPRARRSPRPAGARRSSPPIRAAASPPSPRAPGTAAG